MAEGPGDDRHLHMELLLDSLSDAVAVVDRTGGIILSNEAYERVFRDERVLAVDAADCPVSIEDLRRRVAAGERFSVRFAGELSGIRRWYEAAGLPLPATLGSSGGGILIFHDVTDVSLRRLQEEFVAIVAHELRTPLTALRGYIELLRRRLDQDAGDDARLIGLADEQARRLGRLVDELFDVTRAEAGGLSVEPRRVRLRPIIERTVELAQSLSTQPIVVEELDGIVLEADEARLQQVLLNVLTNAQRHAVSSPVVMVRAKRKGPWVAIEVEDRGPGMRAEVRESLFSRFHVDPSSPGRGLGLGLYISRQIVAAHGGTIEAESEPGRGTTFRIRLPLRAGDARDGFAGRRGPRED